MFKTVIENTQMTSGVANSILGHISGDSWNGDFTFLSTLRALVAPRMQEGDRLNILFEEVNHLYERAPSNEFGRVVSTCFNPNRRFNKNVITVYNLASVKPEIRHSWLELLKTTFCEAYAGWHRLEKVTEFFIKAFYVLCFVNPETRQVAIIADSMDIRRMHYLQCSILAFLPWYFDPSSGVSPEEMELIQSLREKTSTKYKDCIEKIAKKYDFRAASIRKLLTGFETKYEAIERSRTLQDINRLEDTIREYNAAISGKLITLRDKNLRLIGLETKIAQDDGESEIMEYFLANNKLFLESVTDSRMVFSVMGYATYFDEDLALSIIDNSKSYIYRPNGRDCNDYIPAEDMKKLMYEIFISRTIKIKLCAAYHFSLGRQEVGGIEGYNFRSEFNECMPNTHIDEFECLGGYSVVINQMIKDNNYIGAVEQCIASCQSLNFADSTVMERFIRNLYGLPGHTRVNNRCIELNDGRIVTAKEAAEWLKEQEVAAHE